MDGSQIVRLDALSGEQAGQAAGLLVDSFYSVFRPISKEREVLLRLLGPCIQPECFYVLVEAEKTAGLIALSDHRKRALVIDRDVCVSVFGRAKGPILAWQLTKIMGEPAVMHAEHGYLDFLATAPEQRRRGTATLLMEFVERQAGAQALYLDVLASNEAAIGLYQKLGYQVEREKGGLWQRISGMGTMRTMKKVLA